MKTVMKIVAPINSPQDVELFHEAGASELYCGYLPKAWTDRYGFSDMLNKRQGMVANLTEFNQLVALQEKAAKLNMPVALTLNTSYTEKMLPMVIEIAENWDAIGGDAIMVSDPTLFMMLQKKCPGVKRHLSILANAFNAKTLNFFQRFGTTRAVLPRELGIAEMKTIIAKTPGMEFEVMALNDKCRFIDGLCHFYHSTAFKVDQRTAVPYKKDQGRAVINAYDLSYTGHGCSIIFNKTNPQIFAREILLPGNPGCAACFIGDLMKAGISYLKLGGRGLPSKMNAQNIRFMKQAIDLSLDGKTKPEQIRDLYQKTYGHPCNPGSCYYAEWMDN